MAGAGVGSVFLYRGDSRDESIIFAEGFHAREPDLAKDSHTEAEVFVNARGYISTSKSAGIAAMFPLIESSGTHFVYVLNVLPQARCDRESEDPSGLRHCLIPKKIAPQEIKGVWKFSHALRMSPEEFRLFTDCVEGKISAEKLPPGLATWVPNPRYVPREIPLSWAEKVGKFFAGFLGSASASEPSSEAVKSSVRAAEGGAGDISLKPIFPARLPPMPQPDFAQHLWINTCRQQNPFSITLERLTTLSFSERAASSYESYRWIQNIADSSGSSFFNSRLVDEIDRHIVRSSFDDSIRWGDTYREAFDRANRALGYPRGFDYDRFVALLRATGLVGSYKNIHPWARISARGSRGQIGGVAAEVGTINGFEHSSMHLTSTPRFLLPLEPQDRGLLPFSEGELQQILRELAQAIFIHDALPFFSLHFEPHQSRSSDEMLRQFSVIHPAYQQTLVGLTIAILDFWMKGFLNGGTYTEAFLKSWAKAPYFDEASLKAHWVDLQKMAEAEGIDYQSFRERCAEAGLDEFQQGREGQRFSVSFRILSHQQGAGFDEKEGVFLLKSHSFRVEYTIHPTAEFAESLAAHRAIHGKYPEDYERFDALCRRQAKDIQESMPRFSLFRKYFAALDVITFLSYYFHNLKQVGLQPHLTPMPRVSEVFCPEIFPTFPVRYFKKHPVSVSLKDMLFPLEAEGEFQLSMLSDRLSAYLDRQFSPELLADNPLVMERLKPQFRAEIEKKIRELLTQYEKRLWGDVSALMKVAGVSCGVRGTLGMEEYLDQVESALMQKLTQTAEKEAQVARMAIVSHAQDQEKAQKKAMMETIGRLIQRYANHRDENLSQVNQQWGSLSPLARAFDRNRQQYESTLSAIHAEYAARVAEMTQKMNAELSFVLSRIQADQSAGERELLSAIEADRAKRHEHPWLQGVRDLREEWLHPFRVERWNQSALEACRFSAEVLLSTFEVPQEKESLKIFGGCGLSFEPLSLMKSEISELSEVCSHSLGVYVKGGQAYAGFGFGLKAEPVLSLLDYEELAQVFPIEALQPIHSGASSGLNPLFFALYKNDEVEAIRVLEENPGLAVSSRLEKGLTALHLAIALEMFVVAERLIEQGADLGAKTETEGKTPWHGAAEKGQVRLIRAMRASGRVDPAWATPDGKTALFFAVESQDLATFRELLDVPGIDVNVIDREGMTPLKRAILLGRFDMAEALREHPAIRVDSEVDLFLAQHQGWGSRLSRRSYFPECSPSLRREMVRQGKILLPFFPELMSLSDRQACFEWAVFHRQPMMARKIGQALPAEKTRRGWIELDHVEPSLLETVTPEDWYWAAQKGSKKVFHAIYQALKARGILESVELNCLMLSVMKGGRTSLIEWMLSQYPWLSQAGLADRSPDWRLNDHGYVTPIGIASQLNRIDWIEIFLRSDADFDDVIDHAMHHRSLPLIKALVEWAKEFQEVSPAKDYLGRIEYGMGGKALRYALQGDPLPMETLLGVHPLKDFSVFRNQMAFIEGWNTKNRLLSLAIEHRSIEWIDRLLDAGAELNVKAPAPSYAFPLRSASWTNDRALVSHLLDRGADPFIVLYESHSDKKPVTFVDDVAKQGHESIRELLIERGLISPEDRRHKQGLVSAFKAKKARIMKALISQDESSFEQELKFFDLNCFSLIEWKGIAFEAEAGSRSEPLMFWIATYRAAWALRILAKDHAWRNYLINKESVVIYDNQIGQLGVLDSAGNSFLHGLFAWPEDEARAGWEILKAVAYENRKYGQYGDWKGGVGRGISHSLFMQPNKAGITPVDLVFAKGWDFLLSDPVFYSQWRISKKEDKFCAEFLSDATGKTLLHQVVSLGDLARLEFYLRQIPEAVDSPDVYGRTPLMWAAERANRAVVRCLLNAGANPALVDRDRRNLMHFVGSKNTEEHEALFAELIATLPLPVLRQKSDLEGTPLFQAIIHGWVRAAERLEILLGSREVRRKCRDGRSILHCCVLSRALKIKGLFEHYLALYAKDPSGIDVCPVPKHSGFIRESSLQSITPLMLAAQLGRAEWFLLLLQHGANPLKKMRAQDAFSFAVFANTPEMTEIVCRHDLLRKTENLAVRLWFVGVLSGNRLILEQFLLAGFFINQQDEGIGHGDENALHYAANRGHTAIAAFLVAGGIDRHLKNRAGETPRDLAKKQGYWGVVKVIGGGSDGLC